MMKYYIDTNNVIFAYPDDGSQDELIGEKRELSRDEAMAIANPAPTTEQLVKIAEEKKVALIAEATQIIAPLKDALDGDYIDEADKPRLVAWQKYRYALTKVDPAKPVWPDKPE